MATMTVRETTNGSASPTLVKPGGDGEANARHGKFAGVLARIFTTFLVVIIMATIAGVWYKAFWLGWVMQ